MNGLRFVPAQADVKEPDVFVQGVHYPAMLVEKSGVWIKHAGSAMLSHSEYSIDPVSCPSFIVVDEGELRFVTGEHSWTLSKGESVVIPADTDNCKLEDAKDCRLLWFSLDGPLTSTLLRQINALNLVPAKQGMLPSQVLLIRQIVQVLVRHNETSDASFQLAQLLWGIIAAHKGHSVATNAVLSHEIARVVDAMRQCQFKESFSLAEMAAISRMPVEAFRKRFTVELGIPPLGYLQFQKMERAKTLLRSGMSVREAGVEIGMTDPYHFSKQFKHVVGMSPTAYLRHVGSGIPEE
ncbi:MAG: helix-turn-helix domain-containing protein [Clostridia bacterium]|nr:helix-turn-helix domain-containing protein [Clostridia bacterium]